MVKRRFASRALVIIGPMIALMIATAGFWSPAAGQKANLEANKLSVGLAVPALSYLPCWIADQKGFLKEEGITDVKVLTFRGDAEVLQALAGGTVDISVSSLPGLVESIKSGQKFKAFWGASTSPTSTGTRCPSSGR